MISMPSIHRLKNAIPHMTWYQDHGESYNYEDLHHPEETHQPLPVKTNM
jgi:hypothetical protein